MALRVNSRTGHGKKQEMNAGLVSVAPVVVISHLESQSHLNLGYLG